MSRGHEEYPYQPQMKYAEELRQRINNAGFSDEFKQQIKSAQKEEGRKMFERLTIRTDICIEPENDIVYHNPNDPDGMYNILDLADCLWCGGEAEARILSEISRRLAAYEDSGLTPEEVQELAKAKAEGRLVVLPETGVKDLSDGYHTFNELYFHRMMLFAVICHTYRDKAWKSKLHADGTMFDGDFIVGIETPMGHYTYHYNLKYWEVFNVKELERAPEWDGHQPNDIDRLFSLTKTQNEAAEKALGGGEE